MSEAMLELRGVRKSWGRFTAVADVSLAIAQGTFLSLLGPSGCGKTTLLRLITGYLQPDAGKVLVQGRDVTRLPTWRRNMGMVFQSFALFPHLSVANNVAFPLRVRRMPTEQARRRVAEALALVHLDRHAAAFPRELSGGQQQRVGLARAIAYRPTILLLDEPLSNLDAGLREEMRVEISQVTRELGITSVYVTHDQREALALSDTIAVMRAGEVVQFGTPEDIYRCPVNAFVAGFVGYANQIPVRVERGIATIEGAGTLEAESLRSASGQARAFIHASDIALGRVPVSEPNHLACTVADVAFMGDHIEYLLEAPAGIQLKAHSPVTAAFARGAVVDAWLPPASLVVVPEDRAPPNAASPTG